MFSANNAISRYVNKYWAVPNGYRHMLKVSLPLIASMGTATIMEVTDRLFLSRYSVDALAASVPASSASLIFLLTLMGVTGYVGVFIAHYTGANLREHVGTALWQSIYLSIAGGIILAFMCLLARPMFALAGADVAIMDLEIVYFRILSLGGVIALLGYSLGCFFTGRGKSRQVMFANLVAAAINVPLNYALIFGKFGFPELGIAGAGLATVIGWTVSTAILAYKVFTPENDKLYAVRRNWRLNFSYIKKMLRYGLPSGAELFMEMLATTIFVFLAGYLGTTALAASNIAFTINGLAYLPMIGIYTATSILVGQAMGAGNPKGAERAVLSALHLIAIYMVILSALFVLVPDFLIAFFKTDGDFIAIRDETVVLLRFVALYCLFDSFCLVYFGALKGAGDTVFVMILMTVGCVVLAGGAIGILVVFKSLYGIWAMLTVYIGLMGLGAYIRYRQGVWKKMKLIGHHGNVVEEK